MQINYIISYSILYVYCILYVQLYIILLTYIVYNYIFLFKKAGLN